MSCDHTEPGPPLHALLQITASRFLIAGLLLAATPSPAADLEAAVQAVSAPLR